MGDAKPVGPLRCVKLSQLVSDATAREDRREEEVALLLTLPGYEREDRGAVTRTTRKRGMSLNLTTQGYPRIRFAPL